MKKGTVRKKVNPVLWIGGVVRVEIRSYSGLDSGMLDRELIFCKFKKLCRLTSHVCHRTERTLAPACVRKRTSHHAAAALTPG